MKRVVYSPYVWAYIKADDGVIDVSPYIVSGNVDRKLNQVSSASLVLRNPVQGSGSNLLFTEHVSAANPTPHPMFHPMDPIVIVMQRLQGAPVQVFTGYLDTTPYIQLYPGTCQVQASCTLKRLLYTLWDPALPSVQEFLTQFGWVSNTSGIWNPTAEEKRVVGTPQGGLRGQFNDGSIGALLFAVLNIIGDWDASTIWIESLPDRIKPLVLNLYKRIAPTVQSGDVAFESLIQQILGSTSQGSGGPNSGGGSGFIVNGSFKNGGKGLTAKGQQLGASQLAAANTLLSVGTQYKASVLAMQAIIFDSIYESDLGLDRGPNSSGYCGLLGGSSTTWGWSPGVSDDQAMATSWYQGGRGFQANGGISASKSPFNGYATNSNVAVLGSQVTAATPFDSQGISTQYENQAGVAISTTVTEAQAIVAAWAAGGSGVSPSNTTPSNNGLGHARQTGAAQASTAPAATAHTPSNHGLGHATQTDVARLGAGPGGAGATGGSTGSSTPATKRAGRSPGGKTGGTPNTTTRFDVIVAAANAITGMNFPYSYGGGHTTPGLPTGGNSGTGFDCTGAVCAVLYAAGLVTQVFYTGNEVSVLGSSIASGLDTGPNPVNVFVKNLGTADDHSFLQIGTRYFGTSGVEPTDPAGGPGWFGGSPSSSYLSGFQQFHVPQKLLQATGVTNALPAAAGGPGGSQTLPAGGAGGGGGGGTSSGGSGTAAAFSTMLDLPSIFTADEAIIFTGKRAFIADSPLFPFIQQLTAASLRSFCSMPNGNFYAFYPDYFGFFGRVAYWEVLDIEIIDASIDLNDDALVTHMAVAGDVTTFSGEVTFWDLVETAGIFDISDALATGYVGNTSSTMTGLYDANSGKTGALSFLQRYGARPYVEEVPMIRSPFFELFLAFQNFMLAWAKTFMTTIELTFMPELFPGGLLAIPEHNLRVYIEEVSHAFDYVQGFTTTINVSAPSAIPGDANSRPNLSLGNARAAALSIDAALSEGIQGIQDAANAANRVTGGS